ncbi:MAG: AraC family transcriptional regulator [Caldilineaceae bacterium]
MNQPKRIQLPQITISARMPRPIVAQQSRSELLKGLWVESTGYFPHAQGHITERAPENVDFYLLIYCLSGQGWFQSAEQTYMVKAGDLVVALPGLAHGYGAADGDPWTIQWVHFNGAQAAALLALAGITNKGCVISLEQRHSLFSLFNDILTTLQAGYSLHHLAVAAACLRYILSRLAFINTYTPPLATHGLNVQQIIELMLNNLDKRYRLDDLASRANMSCVSFSRLFRQKTGYAPMDYFIRLKIQRACELLETSELPVGKISKLLGYDDPYYFSRLFKQLTQASPTQYRMNSRNSTQFKLE